MRINSNTVKNAKSRIETHATETPLFSNFFLDKRLGANVLIKAECLQHGGAFKFRGAFNRLSQLTKEERKLGIVAFSSGNHAQGVALAAKKLNIPALIVMPKDAPAIKLQRTHDYGAEVFLYNRQTESREEIAASIAKERGAVLVPSFDDPHIISGQGTCGLEIVEQCKKACHTPEVLMVPCGGGGLISGVSTAVKSYWPEISIYAVEPEGFDDHSRSLLSGKREQNNSGSASICDALLTTSPGELTWTINKNLLSSGLVVTDDEVAHAISFAFQYLKLVVEPGGAVALAALLHQKIDVSGKTVVCILSGGNISNDLFIDCLNRYSDP